MDVSALGPTVAEPLYTANRHMVRGGLFAYLRLQGFQGSPTGSPKVRQKLRQDKIDGSQIEDRISIYGHSDCFLWCILAKPV